ncbi:MAG: glycosyltransferase [Phycisphaerae bacterium]|jgi:GT2 family glycosyltransferase/glycosyltransferase involved in cell wall biosynthesis
MDVSVIIVSFNTRDILEKCIESVYAQTNSLQTEIIVVDNASSDGSADMVAQRFENVQLIRNGRNVGFAAANNQAIGKAKGKYILLLNSDTVVLDRAIEKVFAFAEKNQQAAVVGCRVLNPDGTVQRTCSMFPSALNMVLSSSYLYKLFPRNKFFGREMMTWWDRNDVREVEVVSGCFMLVRREVVEQVGLMDEEFFLYAEETEWCYRFAKAGWKMMFTPDAEIIHYGGASGKAKNALLLLQLRAGILQFIKKHKSRIVYMFCCAMVGLFFMVRVPYWFLKWLFGAGEQRIQSYTILKAYLRGTFKSFAGAKALCVKTDDTPQKISTIFFGGEDYWYHNRGHIDMQLIRRMSRLGPALYINSIVMQKPRLLGDRKFFKKLRRKFKSIMAGLKESGEGFYVYSPFSLPLHHIAIGRRLNKAVLKFQIRRVMKKLRINDPIVWVACPAACESALSMQKSKLVYQRTDRFEEFPNVDSKIIGEYDRRLKAEADLTVFVNRELCEQESGQCRKAIYLDHGVDYELFAGAEEDRNIPEQMREIGKPIVGFFGGIDDHTFDLKFVEQVVDLLGDLKFVFVGNTSIDCSALAAKKNVVMIGQQPYERIPHFGKCFDAAIMPWRQNRWIQVCNPVKLKEYLALGKPVISTPFSELNGYSDVVYSASTPQEFADCITAAIKQDNEERKQARRAKVRNSSWESKSQLVLGELFNGELSKAAELVCK